MMCVWLGSVGVGVKIHDVGVKVHGVGVKVHGVEVKVHDLRVPDGSLVQCYSARGLRFYSGSRQLLSERCIALYGL